MGKKKRGEETRKREGERNERERVNPAVWILYDGVKGTGNKDMGRKEGRRKRDGERNERERDVTIPSSLTTVTGDVFYMVSECFTIRPEQCLLSLHL